MSLVVHTPLTSRHARCLLLRSRGSVEQQGATRCGEHAHGNPRALATEHEVTRALGLHVPQDPEDACCTGSLRTIRSKSQPAEAEPRTDRAGLIQKREPHRLTLHEYISTTQWNLLQSTTGDWFSCNVLGDLRREKAHNGPNEPNQHTSHLTLFFRS